MAIVPVLPQAEFGPYGHLKDAPHCIIYLSEFIYNLLFLIKYTPGRKIQGRFIQSYDDRFILGLIRNSNNDSKNSNIYKNGDKYKKW